MKLSIFLPITYLILVVLVFVLTIYIPWMTDCGFDPNVKGNYWECSFSTPASRFLLLISYAGTYFNNITIYKIDFAQRYAILWIVLFSCIFYFIVGMLLDKLMYRFSHKKSK